MKCTDWEMGQSWRKWRTDYGEQWEAAFQETYELKMKEQDDTHFYVGTIRQHPKNGSWLGCSIRRA
jgi:hypothetical protein